MATPKTLLMLLRRSGIITVFGKYSSQIDSETTPDLPPAISTIKEVAYSKACNCSCQSTPRSKRYDEVITYSFVDKKLEGLLSESEEPLTLANPISSAQTVMRTTLWSGLVGAIMHNSRRQHKRLRLFEVGLRFVLGKDDGLQQIPTLAGVVYGDLYPEQWGESQKGPVDFFDLKNDVNNILQLFLSKDDIKYVARCHGALHPSRSVCVLGRGIPIGFMGEVHPLVKQELEIDGALCLFELYLPDLIGIKLVHLKNFPYFLRLKGILLFW